MTSESGPFRSYPWPLEQIRRSVRFLRFQRVKFAGPARFSHGREISFAKGADVRSPHFVELGDRISFGKNFTCEVDMRVGSDVLISSNVSFIGRDHPFDDLSVSVYASARVDTSVVEVGSNVLIGYGSIVVGTAMVGDGCIVGAGSVVVHDLPPNMICAGVPAKAIRSRYPTA